MFVCPIAFVTRRIEYQHLRCATKIYCIYNNIVYAKIIDRPKEHLYSSVAAYEGSIGVINVSALKMLILRASALQMRMDKEM